MSLTINNTAIPANAITDNKGNTYTKVAEAINASSLDHAAIFYAKNVTGGASFTVTSSVIGTLGIHEYSGVATSSPFDKAASSTGLSTKPTSGNVTTTLGQELYVGVAWSGQDTDTWTGGSGYTLRETETNNATAERFASEDATIATASTTAARYSVPTSENWAAAIATFKPLVTTSGGSGLSSDATSSRTTLFKNSATSTFGGSSYTIATTSGAITDTYTTATSTDWVMAAIALRPATTTTSGGTSTGSTTIRYIATDHLGGTNIVMDQSGVVEALDYYPYGGQRIDTKVGTYTGTRNKYAQTIYDTTANLNYAMARYQDPVRGQFLSEDPVFLGTQQNLTDPQSLNSYNYANSNPITKSDPTGRCPICVPIAIGAGVGLIGGIGSQAFNDYLSGDFGRRSFQENLGAYGVAGVSGATVGAGTVAAGIAAPFVGITGVGATVAAGVVSGTLTGATSLAGDRLLGQQTDYGGVAVNAGLSALTAGALKTLPAVRGRLPNFGTSAFYAGAHTARQGAEEFFSGSIQSFGQTAYRSVPSFSAGSSGSSRGSIVQQLQSIVSALQGIIASLSGSGNKK